MAETKNTPQTPMGHVAKPKPVRVTEWVLWFPNTGEDVKPQPMVVEEVFGTGMIAGNIFSRGQVLFKGTVQHRNSQLVKDNPKVAARDGVYLTVDEYYGQSEKAPFDK